MLSVKVCCIIVTLKPFPFKNKKKNPFKHNSLHHIRQLVGFLKVRGYHPLAQQPTWKNALCPLPMATNSIHSQQSLYMEEVPSIRNLRTRHAVAIREPLYIANMHVRNEKKSNCTDLPQETGEIIMHHY